MPKKKTLPEQKNSKIYNETDLKNFKIIKHAMCNVCSDVYGYMSCENCIVNLLDDEITILSHKKADKDTEEYLTD